VHGKKAMGLSMNLGAPASLPACSRESLAGEDAGAPRLAIRSWSQSTAERAFHEPTVWCPGFKPVRTA